MFDKKLLIILLLLIVPTFSSLLRPGYFPMHDDMQAMRLLQMDKCVKDGQIPCRWVPDMGYGYGYPQFNYYAPLPYYAMEGFHLIGFDYLDSVKAGIILGVFIAGCGMYLLGSSLWGKTGGMISALFYAYAPHSAVDIFVRGAVGEFWGMAFLPLILWSIKKVFEKQQKAKLWLALSLAALITSHNITALIFIPVIVVWMIFLSFNSSDSPIVSLKKQLKPLFGSFIWAFSLSAFFLLPAWFEKKFVHIETMLAGYFNYLAHFVSLGQLLFSTYWGYGSSELGPYDDISFTVGLLHWVLPLLTLVLFVILKKRKELFTASLFVTAGWLALFMSHSKSIFFWENMDILSYLQFPWRFLVIATFAFSVAVGSIALLFPKKRALVLVGLIPVILLFYSSNFRPNRWIEITDAEKFSGELWDKQQTISIFDYLPIYAKFPSPQKAPDEPVVIEGSVEILSGEKGTDWQKWMVKVGDGNAKLQLPLYYFPGWKVWVDNQEVSINYDNDLGLITFEVSEGEHEIEAKLTDTPIRKYGNLLSLVGLAAIPLYLRNKKK